MFSAMEAMKPLVDSLGKEQVKRMVDMLGLSISTRSGKRRSIAE
jgi:hypothetical protein